MSKCCCRPTNCCCRPTNSCCNNNCGGGFGGGAFGNCGGTFPLIWILLLFGGFGAGGFGGCGGFRGGLF